MTRFLIGMVVGLLGYWAYERSLLPMPKTSEQSQSPIIRPTAQEVAGRPSEPIPG